MVRNASFIQELFTRQFQREGKLPLPLSCPEPVHLKVTFFFKFQKIQTGKDKGYSWIHFSIVPWGKRMVGLISLRMTESWDLKSKSKNKSLRSSNKTPQFTDEGMEIQKRADITVSYNPDRSLVCWSPRLDMGDPGDTERQAVLVSTRPVNYTTICTCQYKGFRLSFQLKRSFKRKRC